MLEHLGLLQQEVEALAASLCLQQQARRSACVTIQSNESSRRDAPDRWRLQPHSMVAGDRTMFLGRQQLSCCSNQCNGLLLLSWRPTSPLAASWFCDERIAASCSRRILSCCFRRSRSLRAISRAAADSSACREAGERTAFDRQNAKMGR
jgi:hypothetical protein